MDQEAKWLRKHGARYRLSQTRQRRLRKFNSAFGTVFRRLVDIVSVFALLLMLISLALNWSKPGIGTQILWGLLCLALINGSARIMEWLFQHFAGGIQRR